MFKMPLSFGEDRLNRKTDWQTRTYPGIKNTLIFKSGSGGIGRRKTEANSLL